jgi:hypothetical protein
LLTSIAPGITKNDSSSTALEAVSQPINSGAAQHWGQLLMFGIWLTLGDSARLYLVRDRSQGECAQAQAYEPVPQEALFVPPQRDEDSD